MNETCTASESFRPCGRRAVTIIPLLPPAGPDLHPQERNARHYPIYRFRRTLAIPPAAFILIRNFEQNPTCCFTPTAWPSKPQVGRPHYAMRHTMSAAKAGGSFGEETPPLSLPSLPTLHTRRRRRE